MTLKLPSGSAPELKFTALDLKHVETDGAFEGYASLFNREDMGRDIVMPGAFAESLARRGARGIRLLFQHDPNQPIGIWQHVREDGRGLFVHGQLMPDIEKAREVLSLMRAGALDGLSIGFKAMAGRRDPKSGIRRLTRIDLWEISIVTFPMLPEARVSAVKAAPFAARAPSEREFERWLTRDAGLTRSEARAVLASGLKGLRSLRDAGRGQTARSGLAHRIRAAAFRLRHDPSSLRTDKT